MKITAPSIKLFLLLLFTAALSACKYEDPPLSIFEWRASASNNVEQVAHAGDGEFYFVNRLYNRDRFQLSHYQDQRKIWEKDIPVTQLGTVSLKLSEQSNGARLLAVVASQGTSHTVYLYNQKGDLLQQASFDALEQATVFNASGNELFIVQHNQANARIVQLVNSTLQERWHQDGNTLRPILRSAANGWILQLNGRTVINVDGNWQSRWNYTAVQGQGLGEPFVSSTAVVLSQKAPVAGMLFLALENGEDSFVPSAFERKIVALGNDGNPYVLSNVADNNDDRRLRKINRNGQILFQSIPHYNDYVGIQNLREMDSGKVILMTTESTNGGLYENSDVSKIDVLTSSGSLERSYTALPTITTLNGCVEYCKVYYLQPGYYLSQLFIENDGDLYAVGSYTRHVTSPIESHRGIPFHGKVDPTKQNTL